MRASNLASAAKWSSGRSARLGTAELDAADLQARTDAVVAAVNMERDSQSTARQASRYSSTRLSKCRRASKEHRPMLSRHTFG